MTVRVRGRLQVVTATTNRAALYFSVLPVLNGDFDDSHVDILQQRRCTSETRGYRPTESYGLADSIAQSYKHASTVIAKMSS